MLKLTRKIDDPEELRSICIGRDLLVLESITYEDKEPFVTFEYEFEDENIPKNVFTLKKGQFQKICSGIEVQLNSCSQGGIVGIGINAPQNVSIIRAELLDNDYFPDGNRKI